jgi:hypothetical protein
MWRFTMALFAILLASSAAMAQEHGDGWISDINGCRVWDGAPLPDEHIIWSGACKSGYADGKGTLHWYAGTTLVETYEGTLQGGHYNGRGVQTWANGARYEGDFVNDRHQGRGTYRTVDGRVFTGQWASSVFQD